MRHEEGGVRVLRHRLGPGFDPARVHVAIVGQRSDSAWLDGGPDGVSIIALGQPVVFDGPVLPILERELRSPRVAEEPGLEGFAGGLIGYLGYELRGETTGAAVPAASGPRTGFLAIDRFVVVDGATGATELRALGAAWDGELLAWRDGTADALRASAERRMDGPPDPEPTVGAWAASDDEYLTSIAACRSAIRDGDAYQLCLTNEFRIPARSDGTRVDAVALHRRLRASSPTHHGGLLRIGSVDLVSASPERFLRIRGGVIETSPIKGTRPRGADPEADAAARADLVGSDKERAENLMIVDLVRNDLSRVCDPASVEVTRLFDVEAYAQVHQLVSTVRGRLRDGMGTVDAIRALFPAGSMTGAPKRRATELLDAIERRPRGPYAGAFGWLGVDGAADLAMTIRGIVQDDDGISVRAGGGITALSDPDAELEEVRVKAAPLLRALGVSTSPSVL